MIKQLLAGAAAVGLLSGVALAQTYPPAPPPPPWHNRNASGSSSSRPVPVPVPGPSTSTTTTTVTPSPDSVHRDVNVHKEVDKKGNTVIEKDIQREGVAGSAEIHKKIETAR